MGRDAAKNYQSGDLLRVLPDGALPERSTDFRGAARTGVYESARAYTAHQF